MHALRWMAALPAGLLAAIAAHFFVSFALSIGHGFETISAFWGASDMNGMPFSGTYIVLVTRAIAAAALVGVIAYTVPKFNLRVGISVAALVATTSVVWLGYLAWALVASGAETSIGIWYRTALEAIGLAGGAFAGAGMGARAAVGD